MVQSKAGLQAEADNQSRKYNEDRIDSSKEQRDEPRKRRKEERKQERLRKKKGIKVSRLPPKEVKIKDTISALSIPDEVLRQCTVMTVLGRQEITVEGHEGIQTYETDCIRVRIGKDVISVNGTKLVIDYYNDEELKIVGCINQICWESR